MKLLQIALLSALQLFVLITVNADESKNRQISFNLENENLALQGYDPVSYFQKAPLPGKNNLRFEYLGVTYKFATEENRNAFRDTPEKFEPQYGGWCAYGLLDDDLVAINPESYKIIENKLYLFYDGFWGNTLKRWNNRIDKTPEAELIIVSKSNWEKKKH